jgi:transcriptional regulator NrdR family protein
MRFSHFENFMLSMCFMVKKNEKRKSFNHEEHEGHEGKK